MYIRTGENECRLELGKMSVYKNWEMSVDLNWLKRV